MKNFDHIIIGAGIIGLSIAKALKKKSPNANIMILDKEQDIAFHASGRNSGVLHAGFYYTADSLKAKFTVEGSQSMRKYCEMKGISINACGKLVVAQNEDELEKLYELERRGQRNGSNVKIIDESQAKEIEPNVKTFQKALYSPDTASIDPTVVCQALKTDLKAEGIEFLFNAQYLSREENTILTTQGDFTAKKVINCSGLYADKIARDFGFGFQYTMIPFKGLYLKYTKNKTDVRVNIYPVPNLHNPFLGVHFTKTVYGDIKIGPTAIPAFWRENYNSWERFRLKEFSEIMYHQMKLFFKNSFNFRDLAFEEMHKYQKSYFVSLAARMVQHIDAEGFTEYTKPGIRAQLLDKKKLALLQDFVVEGDEKSIHILNAVSPAFTCAFPFSEFIATKYILKSN